MAKAKLNKEQKKINQLLTTPRKPKLPKIVLTLADLLRDKTCALFVSKMSVEYAEFALEDLKKKNKTPRNFIFYTLLDCLFDKLVLPTRGVNEEIVEYVLLDERPKQMYLTVSDPSGITVINYTPGVILRLVLGVRFMLAPRMKKQKKGFVKTLNFSKDVAFKKLFQSLPGKPRSIGVLIKGRPRFAANYDLLFSGLSLAGARVLFTIWIPRLSYSFKKRKNYGRIKRNLRKRIVKSVVSRTRKLKKAAEF